MDFGEFLDGSGRIGRKDYIVWSVMIGAITAIVGYFLGAFDDDGSTLLSVLTIIPSIIGIFLGIKRVHDFNKSGWLMVLSFVPFVNLILVIALWLWPGDKMPNQYGLANSGSPFPALH